MRYRFLAALAIAIGTPFAMANYSFASAVYFMPGDAFFHARLTKAVCDGIPEGETIDIILSYEPAMTSPPGFSGWAGFQKLKIVNVPRAFVDNLRKLYDDRRGYYRTQLQLPLPTDEDQTPLEINGFRMLVYSKEFNPQRYPIFQKYNEDWTSPLEEKLGVRPAIARAVIYDPFVKHYDAVVDDWRHAADVPALPVTVPDNQDWGYAGEKIEEPVTISFNKIRVYVEEGNMPIDHFKRRWDVHFDEVATDRIQTYRYMRKKVEVGPWERMSLSEEVESSVD